MEMKSAALAGLLGLSTRRVGQLVSEGIAVRTAVGTYDAAATIQNYIAHVSGKTGSKDAELNRDREDARLKKEQADGHALKNAQTRGELVPAEHVAREWEGIVRTVRSAMLAVPSRLRRRSASSFGTAEIEMIDREIRDALEAVSNDAIPAPPGAEGGETATENTAVDMD